MGRNARMVSLLLRIIAKTIKIRNKLVPIKPVDLSGFPPSVRVLNLGCGTDMRPGWINIDAGAKASSAEAGTLVIRHDLRRGLPFDDACIDVVYSSHFFEHLNTMDGFALMKHCFRVLKKGGVFRAAMPDARLAIRAYLEGDSAYFAKASSLTDTDLPPPELRSPIDYIDRDARAWGHLTIYDPDKMIRLLSAAGFTDAKVVDFDPAFDLPDELRRFFSFYVEARKS
jgi:SAM-dependent methyltransferase